MGSTQALSHFIGVSCALPTVPENSILSIFVACRSASTRSGESPTTRPPHFLVEIGAPQCPAKPRRRRFSTPMLVGRKALAKFVLDCPSLSANACVRPSRRFPFVRNTLVFLASVMILLRCVLSCAASPGRTLGETGGRTTLPRVKAPSRWRLQVFELQEWRPTGRLNATKDGFSRVARRLALTYHNPAPCFSYKQLRTITNSRNRLESGQAAFPAEQG